MGKEAKLRYTEKRLTRISVSLHPLKTMRLSALEDRQGYLVHLN